MSLAADRRLVGAESVANGPLAKAPAVAVPLRPLSLRINFSWVLAGNLVRAVCRYGMLLLLTHFCGLAVAGQYVVAVAVCTPIWAFVMLGLRGALITDARHEYSLADYLAVRLVASGIGLLVVTGTILLGGYGVGATAAILLVAVAKLLEGISDILRGRLQQQERMDRIAIALFVQGVSGLVLMALAGWLRGGATLVMAALPVAMALTLLLWDIPCCAEMAWKAANEDRSRVRLWQTPLRLFTLARLSVVAFPLAVVGVLIALVPQLPKYAIASICGQEAVAVYTIVSYGIAVGMMVVMALGNAAAPRMAKCYAAGDVYGFSRLVVRLVMLVGGMGTAGLAVVGLFGDRIAVVFSLLSPGVVNALERENVDLTRLIIALSLFAMMLFVTAPLGRALGAMRKFWAQAISMGLGLSMAVLVLPWAVRTHGMIGAAEAMAFSMAIVAFLCAGLVWRELAHLARRESELSKEAAFPGA